MQQCMQQCMHRSCLVCHPDDCREQQNDKDNQVNSQQSCGKCKFNLPAEQICHIKEVIFHNGLGISKHYAPKGEGMLTGDIAWDFVKKSGKKLDYSKGHVINESMDGFKCRDCKYCVLSSLLVIERHVGARNGLCIYCKNWQRD